jgi:general secretion pathway protein F/type IV pilus assembly protein PilC
LIIATLRFFEVIPAGVDLWERAWFRADGAALTLDALADAAEQGRPMTETLGMLSERLPSAPLRRKLARANHETLGGRPVWDSLQSAGILGRNDYAVLQAAERVGNVAWALRELADANERREARRLQWFLQWFTPLVIVGVGTILGYIAVSYFEPLVRMIEAMI